MPQNRPTCGCAARRESAASFQEIDSPPLLNYAPLGECSVGVRQRPGLENWQDSSRQTPATAAKPAAMANPLANRRLDGQLSGQTRYQQVCPPDGPHTSIQFESQTAPCPS